MATADELVKQALKNSNSPDPIRKGYDSTKYVAGLSSVTSSIQSTVSGVKSQYGSNQDTDTSDGLYRIAHNAGLKSQADKILKDNSGEDMDKIFSGGFITDIFDVLNMSSYGVVGLLKGKTFEQGVTNRESFSDKDSLGRYGLTGSIAGIVLDIATDPLTYVAPWTILRKIPGVAKGVKLVGEFAVGSKITKTIEGTDKTYQVLEGGLTIPARLNPFTNRDVRPILEIGEKIQWMFGADPVYKDVYDRSRRAIGVGITAATNLIKPLSKLDDSILEKLLVRDSPTIEGGVERFARKNIDQLQGELDAETFALVKPIWENIDSLGKELVGLGVLGKGKFEENFGAYLKNAYTEFDLARKKGAFGFKPLGIRGTKSRSDTLTKEGAEKLGQIDNPAYLLHKTMLDMSKDVEDAKLFKAINDNFGSKIEQEGFVKISDTSKYQTNIGTISELAADVTKINKRLTPLFSELKSTAKFDRKTISNINSIEREIAGMRKMTAEQLTKFFNYGATNAKVVTRPRRLGIIPDKLIPISNQAKKFETLDEFLLSDAGMQAQRLDMNGDLDRLGYKSVDDFYETVKNPYRAAKDVDVKGKVIPLDAEFDSAYGLTTKSDIVEGRARTAKDTAKPLDDITGLPLKSRIKESIKPASERTTMKDLDLLAKKIRDFNVGFKTGAKTTREGIKEIQSAAISIIKKNFAVSDSGKFLSKVKNATTPDKLEELITKLGEDFLNAQERATNKLGQKNLSRAQKLLKKIERLGEKSELFQTAKISVDDAFRNVERQINDLKFEKTDLLDAINRNKAGHLAGKYIPKQMADYMDELINPTDVFGSRIVGSFKFAKVLLNPATHVRNIMSNMVLNWWKLGVGPWNLHLYTSAIKDLSTNSPMWQRAQKVGGGADGFAANELKGLLDDPSASYLGKSIGNTWIKAKHKIGEVYQSEENVAKLVAFKEMLKKGHSDEEAWKMAESATFNYSQVTPFIRKLRQSMFGLPFITFPLKATPIAIETALKHPQRISVFGKIKNGIENAADIKETQDEKASEPSWVKNGFYFKLPWKDGNGRSAYFDLTYIIPLGDIISGSYVEAATNETGTKEALGISIASKNPAFNLLKELTRNEDFSGNQIFKSTDSWEKVSAQIYLHSLKVMLPPLISSQLPTSYDSGGNKIPVGLYSSLNLPTDEPSFKRNLLQELSSYVGLKVQPMGAEVNSQMNEYNKVKGLRTLLKENGAGKEFTKFYIPK